MRVTIYKYDAGCAKLTSCKNNNGAGNRRDKSPTLDMDGQYMGDEYPLFLDFLVNFNKKMREDTDYWYETTTLSFYWKNDYSLHLQVVKDKYISIYMLRIK